MSTFHLRHPKAKPSRSSLPKAKPLVAGRRQLLDTHMATEPLAYKGNLVRRVIGEPRSFIGELSIGSPNNPAPSGWNRERQHQFKKRLHIRKPRRISIGKWKRGVKVIKPR